MIYVFQRQGKSMINGGVSITEPYELVTLHCYHYYDYYTVLLLYNVGIQKNTISKKNPQIVFFYKKSEN